jgi:diaminobutyrate-2-oxoglutarate transaminase
VTRQAERESSARAYPRRLPVALVSGRGVRVRDDQGNEYLDCLAGAGSLALGHHHPEVDAAIRRALHDEIPLMTLDLTTPLKEQFVDELLATLPPALAHGRILFCGPTGADAVEAAMKLAKVATGRSTLVSFGGGYHGMSSGALSLTGAKAPKAGLDGLLPGVQHLPWPSRYRCPFGVGGDQSAELCARTLEWALTDDHSGITTPAAVLMEPVQGEGGVQPAPEAFAQRVRHLTREHSVPLVVDEVQTGLGRTGQLWASDALGIEPDVIVLSKAIGGGLPLAVVVYREELDVLAAGAHAGTFRGNQLAFAAGAATIRRVVADDLPAHAAAMGSLLTNGLRAAAADDPAVGDVRGPGLMVGVEVVDPDHLDRDGVPVADGARAAAVQRAMLARGVIVETGGRANAVVRFLPPLVIEAPDIERVVDAFASSLADTRARPRPRSS